MMTTLVWFALCSSNRTAYIGMMAAVIALRPTLRSTRRWMPRFVPAIVYMFNCVLAADERLAFELPKQIQSRIRFSNINAVPVIIT